SKSRTSLTLNSSENFRLLRIDCLLIFILTHFKVVNLYQGRTLSHNSSFKIHHFNLLSHNSNLITQTLIFAQSQFWMKPLTILNSQQFELTIKRLCFQLIENHEDFSDTVIIGLQP